MSMRDRVATSCRDFARSRSFAIAIVALLAGCGSAPQDPVTIANAEFSLQGEEQQEFQRQLERGTWLVEVIEQDVDAHVSVESAGKIEDLRESTPRHGAVYKVVSVDAPVDLRVRLRSADHPSWRGKVAVRVARFLRGPTDPPGARELGYAAWDAAGRQHALATPEGWTGAADHLNEAMTQFEAAGDDAARAAAAYALANVQFGARDDWTAAIRAAEVAADLFGGIDDETNAHNANSVRGAAEMALASGMSPATQRAEQKALFDVADRRLAQAAEYFETHALPLRAAFTTNMRGIRALNIGDDDSAVTHFAHALKLAQASNDVSGQIHAKINLAWSRRTQGFVAQAAQEYSSLLPLLDPERQTYVYAGVLNNYGFCLITLGDFDRALRLHTEALELFTRLGQQDERATQLAALGALYFRVGDTHRALETLRAAIAAQESVSDMRGLASTLRLAGNAASAAGQHDMALEYLRRSVSSEANPRDVIRTRVLIAGELRSVGDYNGADAELAEALRSPVAVVRADATAERARLRMARKDAAGAITDLRTADKTYSELGLDFSRIDTTASLAQLLLANKDVPGAARAADESVAIVQRIRFHSSNPEWRARFLSAQYAPFEARIAVDLAQGGAANDAGAWQAFRTADEVRARSLAEQIADGPGAHEADPEASRLRDALTDQQLRLEARLQVEDADAAGTQALRREIEEIRARLDTRLTKVAQDSGSDEHLPESLRQVQEQLPADTIVVAFFVGDSGSHAWLLARDELRHATLPGRARLQRAIDATAESQPGSPAARDADLRLSRLLLGDLLDGVTAKRALLIPDGPLNGVPFAALPVGAGNDLLLDRFLIGYAPSLTLALSPARSTRTAGQTVAVISDPVYAPDDRRLPSLVAAAGTLRSPRQASPNKLTRLPYSALEAKAVIENFGNGTAISLSGFDATPERVEQLASANLSVLHFATHAVARKDSPERSALFLSEYSADGTLRPDSQLTANDIMRSGLKAGVVVLSGCATGDGSMLRGEGVLGLTYGFLVNGSGSVIASLWPVEDASTARFMNEFYRAYRQSGNSAEALRSAQMRSRATSGAAAVWSSFVVRANGFP
jgi:CHAT domain-containing protein